MDINKFLEIENKYGLYSREIESVNYWIYERFWIWNYKICTEKLNLMSSQSIAKQGIWDSILTLGLLLKNCIFRGKIRHTKYDICFVAHERRKKLGDYYECIYTEELRRRYKSSITLEEPFELKHLKPVENKELLYTDYILVEGEAYSRIHSILHTKYYKKIYAQVKKDTENAIREIIEVFRLDIVPEEIYRQLTRRVLIGKVCRTKYDKLICRINPRVIVEVVHYCAQNMMINEIAPKYGIKTIELQHGTMHEEHLAYQYATNHSIKQLPQIILTFAEFWNHIIHLPKQSTEVLATGFPHFEERIKKVKKNRPDHIKNILFLSQGTIGRYLYELACELDMLIDRSQYHIMYKLHPSEYSDWKERYGVTSSNIEVVDNSDTDLYELFAQSSIQVGVYSTAIYEGIGFGLETYIYNIGHADTMKRIVRMGAADYIESAVDLSNKLNSVKKKNNINEILWKSNALENICAVLNSLIVS